jgi:hypothetical protein
MNKRIVTALAAACVLFSNLAFADEKGGYVENQSGTNQSVYFNDDPLAAGGMSPLDARIFVMPTPKRVTLIRPRTQFVSEMLKSVENL